MTLKIYRFLCAMLFLGAFAGASVGGAFAQSSDQNLPTAVLSNEVAGKINALDLGDARLTRHYYAFSGTPGDLLITIDSRNLNGDVDVFTAVTFRPLMKMSIYATSQSPETTKGIYLRSNQILILRVEARTPNDEPGTYRVRFSGSFERFSGGIPVAESTSAEAETASERDNPNRLTSVGATIPRPPAEMVAAPQPTPSPEPSVEKPAEETAASKKTAPPPRRTSGRNPRNRPAPARTTTPAKKTGTPAKSVTETAKTETSKPAEEKPAEETTPEKPKSQEIVAPASARLMIEQRDGTKIDRPMSTVRRVVVEGGMIVITLRTGKIERVLMSQILRMAIEPQ